jgi:hypothetical protein
MRRRLALIACAAFDPKRSYDRLKSRSATVSCRRLRRAILSVGWKHSRAAGNVGRRKVLPACPRMAIR